MACNCGRSTQDNKAECKVAVLDYVARFGGGGVKPDYVIAMVAQRGFEHRLVRDVILTCLTEHEMVLDWNQRLVAR